MNGIIPNVAQKALHALAPQTVNLDHLGNLLTERTLRGGVREWQPSSSLLDSLFERYQATGASLFLLEGFGRELTRAEKDKINPALTVLNRELSEGMSKRLGIPIEKQEGLEGLYTEHDFHQDSGRIVAPGPDQGRLLDYHFFNLAYLLPHGISGYDPAYAKPKAAASPAERVVETYRQQWPEDMVTFSARPNTFKTAWLKDREWWHGVTQGNTLLAEGASRPIYRMWSTTLTD